VTHGSLASAEKTFTFSGITRTISSAVGVQVATVAKFLPSSNARVFSSNVTAMTATAGAIRVVESAWGAVPGLLSVRFPRPLAEPAVPLSRQRALHGFCRQAWLRAVQGLGILLPR